MHANKSRLKKFFDSQVKPGINACSKHNAGISMSILICTAIDFLAKFYSGDPSPTLNKEKYINFLTRYFPSYLPHEEFYKFVRCGLVHSYDMEGEYLIINSSAEWAKNLNMKHDPKHNAMILNPFSLKNDLFRTYKQYLNDLDKDKTLRKKLDGVYGKKPIRKQYLKTPKFKYLVKEGLV